MRPDRLLGTFHGGLVLPGHKSVSTTKPIQPAAMPAQLVLPCQQHIGQEARPVVKQGDQVLKGQMIAEASGNISVPVHAPTSGTVLDIGAYQIPHPSGLKSQCIVIQPDGKDEWIEHHGIDYISTSPAELRERIRDAGIVGLGGAGFPSHIKMNIDAHPETLILNGAECEPWITCDDMLMRERADEIIQGALIMCHALHCKQVIIGIEDNKPEARDAMQKAAEGTDIQVVVVPTRYPAGGEKQLIKVLTGKEVPSQGLPIDIAIVCHNVATAAAIYRAVIKGEPLISRIVTITGPGIPSPVNMDARLGTPAAELIAQAGADPEQLESLTMGGPMMGFILPDHNVPVIKTTNCLLAEPHKAATPPAMPCIRCGTCADVCPVDLLPQQLYWYARARDFDKVQDYHLFDCIECGCCDYVCPSHIPLVQYYRFAKTAIWQQERDKQKADRARERHEFHLERIEREKREREAKRKQKHAELKKTTAQDKNDPKKAAIMAALARVKEKKAQSHVQPKNIENLTDEQKKKIAEAEARRKKHIE